MKQLRTTTDVERRTRAYVEIIIVEWLVTAVAVLALGVRQVFTFDVAPRPSWFPLARRNGGHHDRPDRRPSGRTRSRRPP